MSFVIHVFIIAADCSRTASIDTYTARSPALNSVFAVVVNMADMNDLLWLQDGFKVRLFTW